MIVFLDNTHGIEPEQIGGFFVGWRSPLSAEQLLQILLVLKTKRVSQ
jgi:hypothetical protein